MGLTTAPFFLYNKVEDIIVQTMTYTLNHTIFDDIDTEAQAYCLGCFYFNTTGRIQRRDMELLSIISDVLEYDGPIRKNGQVYEINISQQCFLDKLNFNYNTLPLLRVELVHHFIRGIFDLYGSFNISKQKYLNVNIVLNEMFIQSLRNHLLANLNIATKHYYRYSHTNTVQMMITRTEDAKKFCKWIYQEANYYLTRKFNIWDQYYKKSV